ncbi:MAG: hypothetical protein L3J32_06605 [Rhizobiaceae bacterium]|nr:hypothetical protein [Rhizobiaceae bacterium]
MIRPTSEIEFPPSEFLRLKAGMLARMEALGTSSDSLLAVIAKRLGAETCGNVEQVEALTLEQERLITNMRKLARA